MPDRAEPIVHANTRIGPDATLEPYVLLGVPPRGARDGELPLTLGARAHIRSHTVIYAGNTIGDGFQTGHGVLIRESNTIGDDVSIGSHTVLEHHITLGNRVRVHSNAFIPEFSTLEDGAWIGPNVVLTNAAYPLGRGTKESLRGPIIRKAAKVGANATLLPGIVIGRDALVGAGAVVVEDVPDGAVVVGNPAMIINQVAALDAYREVDR